nr:unnamed protein product [Callosobruchus analis]
MTVPVDINQRYVTLPRAVTATYTPIQRNISLPHPTKAGRRKKSRRIHPGTYEVPSVECLFPTGFVPIVSERARSKRNKSPEFMGPTDELSVHITALYDLKLSREMLYVSLILFMLLQRS